MARTTLTKTVVRGAYASYATANCADVTLTAADVANKNQFVATGNEVVIVQNSDGANPYTVTFTSASDAFGRTGDITTYSLAAGEIGVFGPFRLPGWVQSDGYVYLEGSNAAIKFGVLQIPQG